MAQIVRKENDGGAWEGMAEFSPMFSLCIHRDDGTVKGHLGSEPSVALALKWVAILLL